MSDFVNAFVGTSDNKKLNETQLATALRGMISEEFGAIRIYSQLIESIDNQNVIRVIADVIREEKAHVGEFQSLLYEISPEDKLFAEKGAVEVKNISKLLHGGTN